MAVSCTYTSKLTVVETLGDAYLDAGDKTVRHSGLDESAVFTANTTVPVTKVATFAKALVDGSATIDLRALVGTNAGAVDGNGLKVQFIKLRAKTTNANPITIEPGASNGFDLFGSGFRITLKPGQEILAALKDLTDDIDATHKTLDLTGTGAQVLEVEIVMG